jgi:hypothetical protein
MSDVSKVGKVDSRRCSLTDEPKQRRERQGPAESGQMPCLAAVRNAHLPAVRPSVSPTHAAGAAIGNKGGARAFAASVPNVRTA